jgi:hypothetical protein
MRPAARRRAMSMILVVLSLPVFVIICTLAVDWGRVQLAKTALRAAADSAARYALTGLGDDTCVAKAQWLAAQNPVDGRPPQVDAADVVPGTWDPDDNTFTPAGGAPNAVRVTARQTVSTMFGGWTGVAAMTVTGRATAKFNVIGFGLIGLDSVNMQGNSTASYSSAGGGLATQGNIGSNGNITLGNSTTVRGNTYVGVGKTVSGGSVTGTKAKLTAPLSFPNGDASPYGLNNNDNGNVPNWATPGGNFSLNSNKSVTLPGGNYYFGDFTQAGGSTLAFTGPATIYCYGNFSMSGSTSTSGSVPGNLKLVMVPNPYDGSPPGTVTVGSSSAFYGSIYAPQSAVSIGGNGDVYGSVLGLTVSMTGTGSVWYDMNLDVRNGTLSLVE